MNKADFFNASFRNSLNRSNPEFKIGIDWVLDQHWYVSSFQRICNFLHTEWVDGGSGTNPQYIDIKMQGIFYLLCSRHFNSNRQTCQFTCLLQPGQSFCSNALETTGACSWFPDTCAKHINLTGLCQAACGFQYLLFCFGTAGTP